MHQSKVLVRVNVHLIQNDGYVAQLIGTKIKNKLKSNSLKQNKKSYCMCKTSV